MVSQICEDCRYKKYDELHDMWYCEVLLKPLDRIHRDHCKYKKPHPITGHPCFGCEHAIYSEEGFIDACDMPENGCPRGIKVIENGY